MIIAWNRTIMDYIFWNLFYIWKIQNLKEEKKIS